MREQQDVAVKPKKKFEALQQALHVAQECMLEKDRIIEGLRFDLANLVDQLPSIQSGKFNKAH